MGNVCAVPLGLAGLGWEDSSCRSQGVALGLHIPCSHTHHVCPQQPAYCPAPKLVTRDQGPTPDSSSLFPSC